MFALLLAFFYALAQRVVAVGGGEPCTRGAAQVACRVVAVADAAHEGAGGLKSTAQVTVGPR